MHFFFFTICVDIFYGMNSFLESRSIVRVIVIALILVNKMKVIVQVRRFFSFEFVSIAVNTK